MSRVNAGFARQRHQPVHDRVDLVGVARRAATARSADRALEEAVGGEAVGAVHEQREVIRAVSRRRDRRDLELARADDVTVTDRLVDRDAGLPRQTAADHRDAEPLRKPRDVDDMVAVLMGDEHVRDRRLLASIRSSSGSSTPFESTSTPCPAFAVRDEVGVRRPGRMLGALDDHAN